MDVYLETPRLLFRRLTAGDEALLLDLDSDPEVMRYLNGGVPNTIKQIRESVLPWALQDYGDDRWGVWAALFKPANEFIGWFHFYPSSQPPGDLEVGYRLNASFGARDLQRKAPQRSFARDLRNTASGASWRERSR